MERVKGKTALVTGASRGIGRAIAVELAREGAKVAVNFASNDVKAREVAQEIEALGGTCLLVKADLGNAQEARATVMDVAKKFRHLDVLVNNAGITRDSLLLRMTDEQWIAVIQTNLNGGRWRLRHQAADQRQRRGAHVDAHRAAAPEPADPRPDPERIGHR
jgi:NAD(P)-dependent dehydrogenase (short-subunit alcohol dehydrogenase family)